MRRTGRYDQDGQPVPETLYTLDPCYTDAAGLRAIDGLDWYQDADTPNGPILVAVGHIAGVEMGRLEDAGLVEPAGVLRISPVLHRWEFDDEGRIYFYNA